MYSFRAAGGFCCEGATGDASNGQSDASKSALAQATPFDDCPYVNARRVPCSRPYNNSDRDRLNLAEQQEDDNNDEDGSDNSHPAMSITIAIAPKPTVIATE